MSLSTRGCSLAVGMLIAVIGCSRGPQFPWGTASGKVLLDGQPVVGGCVVFENRELGVSRLAALDSEGHFTETSIGYAGLPAGKYRVAVTSQLISKGDFVPVARPDPDKRQMAATAIPEKYHGAETSDLIAIVKEGRNPPFTFDLKTADTTE